MSSGYEIASREAVTLVTKSNATKIADQSDNNEAIAMQHFRHLLHLNQCT